MSASPGLGARLQILAAAVLFSTGGAAIKATSLGAWQVAGVRSGIAAVALLVVLGARGRLGALTRIGRAPWVGVAYALALTGYVIANKQTTAANAIFLFSTAPIWVAALSPWLLSERPARRDLLLLLVMLGGMALVFTSSTGAVATAPAPAMGNRIAAGAALFWGLTLIGLRRLGRDGPDDDRGGAALAGVVWGNGLAFLLASPWILTGDLTRASAGDLAAVSYLGVVQIGVAYLFLVGGIRRVPAVEVSLLLLLEPVLNPFWAWVLHREVPAPAALAGGGLILLVLALRLVPRRRSS